MTAQNKKRELAVMVGATGALGTTVAHRLVDAGLHLLAIGRREDELKALAATSEHISYVIADIGDDSAIEIIKAKIDATVRMVVHAAGVPVAGGVLEASPLALSQAINIKAGGMLRLHRATDAHLVRGSRLVAVGGHYGFEPTAYAATAGVANAGLTNLMRQFSWALGERGITAHLVAPGPADTERLRNVANARAAQRGVSVEEVFNELKQESAIHAFTTPEQVAWGICLLLAPEADAMAGSSLMLDSGRRHGLP
ncbi:SDR family oxidoreductase [Polynucleobacter sp. MWH-Spelu-300-X4]|uniref:SDR family NAD(P)-dependent oxidoreductase n=1 Tax=Polynucleobacter sp. MWH-Spelu-300-X4 TaxID=2689109 RepID=UPI001BFDB940|nr:SDR family oxidoreductase [Polynucleobacter sp. MWH-Spelu-300-X4]QWD79940.1 SDR family oxidoreductase [Polynucleobacter sp. MWH-Spelu-300-X4]